MPTNPTSPITAVLFISTNWPRIHCPPNSASLRSAPGGAISNAPLRGGDIESIHHGVHVIHPPHTTPTPHITKLNILGKR